MKYLSEMRIVRKKYKENSFIHLSFKDQCLHIKYAYFLKFITTWNILIALVFFRILYRPGELALIISASFFVISALILAGFIMTIAFRQAVFDFQKSEVKLYKGKPFSKKLIDYRTLKFTDIKYIDYKKSGYHLLGYRIFFHTIWNEKILLTYLYHGDLNPLYNFLNTGVAQEFEFE